MKFDEFWSKLVKEISEPKRFKTLKQEKEFEARYSGGIVIVTPGTRYKRPIGKSDFEKVWNKAKNMTKGEQFKRGNFNVVTYHGSYILTLVKHILKDKEIE